MNPSISIIVPCYGVEKYLDKCLNSLVSQTLKDIEIILVDDQSPDRVPIMCNEWSKKDTRIKVIHKENEGLGLARNSGLKIATGQYVAFVDSDDFVDKTMYQKLLAKAKKENADACYCGYSYYDGSTIKNKKEGIIHNHTFNGRKEVDQFLFSMIGLPTTYPQDTLINMCVWRAIYRRKLIQEHNIHFISERIAASEDVTFHASFLPYATKICFLTDHLYYYRFNPKSISHSYPEWKRKSLIGSCYIIKNIFEKHYPKDIYINCYRRHLFRNLKTILRKEAQRNVPFLEKQQAILERLNNPIFKELFNDDFKYINLPLKQRIIYWLSLHKYSFILILLIKLTRK